MNGEREGILSSFYTTVDDDVIDQVAIQSCIIV